MAMCYPELTYPKPAPPKKLPRGVHPLGKFRRPKPEGICVGDTLQRRYLRMSPEDRARVILEERERIGEYLSAHPGDILPDLMDEGEE